MLVSHRLPRERGHYTVVKAPDSSCRSSDFRKEFPEVIHSPTAAFYTIAVQGPDCIELDRCQRGPNLPSPSSQGLVGSPDESIIALRHATVLTAAWHAQDNR